MQSNAPTHPASQFIESCLANPEVPLAVLEGPPGCGKAIMVKQAVAKHFESLSGPKDQFRFVDFYGTSDAALDALVQSVKQAGQSSNSQSKVVFHISDDGYADNAERHKQMASRIVDLSKEKAPNVSLLMTSVKFPRELLQSNIALSTTNSAEPTVLGGLMQTMPVKSKSPRLWRPGR